MGSMSTDLTNQNTREVFLQTLTVYIENGNSKQLVRAILDTGSQKSYISKYVAKFIGIKDPSEKRSKLELQDLALKHFENMILRDDEGRYIVSIPWIEGSKKLEDHFSLAKERLEKTIKTLKFTGRLLDYEQVSVDWEKEGIIEKIATR
ncbi:DUF5641 domain-containing protein [Trichonephila clavata]|uniref:DUF5641 domain-containing protein n=1 Tax=Trichonephila clavata TaxID=2740835 RepID=A0A8X6HCM0_TRICU|nr:DUF5641 domain-containing protein [Trichonephila clavata]